jgi:hypothetical protein
MTRHDNHTGSTRRLLLGAAAGATGTPALNAVTYLDMALLDRPARSTPEDTVRTAERRTGVSLSAGGPDTDAATNRRSGLGALLGIAAGTGTGAVYALVRPHFGRTPLAVLGVAVGLTANLATTAPMAMLGITDPRTWSTGSWARDLLPHLALALARISDQHTWIGAVVGRPTALCPAIRSIPAEQRSPTPTRGTTRAPAVGFGRTWSRLLSVDRRRHLSQFRSPR